MPMPSSCHSPLQPRYPVGMLPKYSVVQQPCCLANSLLSNHPNMAASPHKDGYISTTMSPCDKTNILRRQKVLVAPVIHLHPLT
ncbi:hypothetical protein L2E82_21237 [Cichorium intybus]|uniref:Uncharacterized protein n=1 Tax=Cichorium intybus TaxID=13427 RepID=A0ACB9DVJ9_CICIN|nr:hypothetical protein L2E82_21237 [Cichorium intybus]